MWRIQACTNYIFSSGDDRSDHFRSLCCCSMPLGLYPAGLCPQVPTVRVVAARGPTTNGRANRKPFVPSLKKWCRPLCAIESSHVRRVKNVSILILLHVFHNYDVPLIATTATPSQMRKMNAQRFLTKPNCLDSKKMRRNRLPTFPAPIFLPCPDGKLYKSYAGVPPGNDSRGLQMEPLFQRVFSRLSYCGAAVTLAMGCGGVSDPLLVFSRWFRMISPPPVCTEVGVWEPKISPLYFPAPIYFSYNFHVTLETSYNSARCPHFSRLATENETILRGFLQQ